MSDPIFLVSLKMLVIGIHWTYIWAKNLDILASSVLSKCDVDRIQNSILKIPCGHWFYSPLFHFSRKRA